MKIVMCIVQKIDLTTFLGDLLRVIAKKRYEKHNKFSLNKFLLFCHYDHIIVTMTIIEISFYVDFPLLDMLFRTLLS